jgi:hypothetical protein
MAKTFMFMGQQEEYRYEPLLAGYRNDGVVAVGPPCGWVNENMDVVVEDRRGTRLSEHGVNVLGLEGLLKGVKGEPRKLGLDQIGPVLHDGLELNMAVCALPPAPKAHVQTVNSVGSNKSKKANSCEQSRTPKHKHKNAQTQRNESLDASTPKIAEVSPRNQVKHESLDAKTPKIAEVSPGNQVKHVYTVGGPSFGLAGSTCKLDAQKREDGLASELVPHFHQSGVKVDLACERADGKQRRGPHDEKRGDRFLDARDKHSRSSNSISSRSNTGSSGSDFEVENGKSGMPAWASAYVKESWVDVSSLLEDNDVSSSALGRRNLPAQDTSQEDIISDLDWEQLDNPWTATRVI